MTETKQSDVAADWQAVLDASDEDEFRQAVEPYTDLLLNAARKDLDYYVAEGDLHEQDLTPEDVVGETLIHAWEQRETRPEGMSLRGWLLGTLHHVLRAMIAQNKQYRAEKALSLDEPIPPEVASRGKQTRRQYGNQPDVEITWEDVTPGSAPADLDAPLFTNRDTFHLDPDSRHVVMMHHEFDLPLDEVATMMDRTVEETAKLLGEAHTTLRKHLEDQSEGSSAPAEEEAQQ